MMNRDMIDDSVEHQTEFNAQARNVLPFTDRGFYCLIIDDRKPVIRKVREERQYMYAADQPGKIFFTKAGQ